MERTDDGGGMSVIMDVPGDPAESHSEAAILEFVRELAARRDPWHGLLYRGVSPARIKHSAAVAQGLIEVHVRYLRHHTRGRGRRQHSAEVYGLLAETNEAALVLALAVLDLAFAVLPPGTKDD